jgi:hypothetical protein
VLCVESISIADEAGHPLGDLQPLAAKPQPSLKTARSPSSITFVRNRMMHARAAVNKQGGVRFGLRHIREQSRVSTTSLLISQMFLIATH